MSIRNQLVVIVLSFFLVFVYIRAFLYGVKRYQLTNSSYKKRKKGETFKEWMFYSRYTEEIPKGLLILYYTILVVHLVGLIVCVSLYIMKLSPDNGGLLAIAVHYFDVACIIVIALLFWSPKGLAYERWISRKRGKKRGKR